MATTAANPLTSALNNYTQPYTNPQYDLWNQMASLQNSINQNYGTWDQQTRDQKHTQKMDLATQMGYNTSGNGTVTDKGGNVINFTGANPYQQTINPINAFQNSPYNQNNSSVQNALDSYQKSVNTPFSYDPTNDPQYKNALKLAQQTANLQSKSAMEQLNDRGILNSSVTADQVGQLQQQAMLQANSIIPQLASQAYSQHQQDISNQLNNLNYLTNRQDTAFNQQMQQANLTGYMPSSMLPQNIQNELNQVLDLKQAWKTATPADQQNIAAQAQTLYKALGAAGLDTSKFDGNVGLDQALANIQGLQTPTMARQQQQFQDGVTQAGLTGIYNGTPTLAYDNYLLQKGNDQWTHQYQNTSLQNTKEYQDGILAIQKASQQSTDANRVWSQGNADEQKKIDQATSGWISQILANPTRDQAIQYIGAHAQDITADKADMKTIIAALNSVYGGIDNQLNPQNPIPNSYTGGGGGGSAQDILNALGGSTGGGSAIQKK